MNEVAQNMAWAVVFSTLGGLIGIALILVHPCFLPRLIERMTPNLDEEKEIARRQCGGGPILRPGGQREHHRNQHRGGSGGAGRNHRGVVLTADAGGSGKIRAVL